MTFESLHFKFEHPTPAEPEWKNLVERWYQLDAPAYGLAQFYWQNKSRLKAPDLIILASPGASNTTDRAFVQTGATSPAKFVHTLPSVRVSSLCQVMGWSGPVLGLQKDPQTISASLFEAEQWQKSGKSVWVLSANSNTSSIESKHLVYAFLFDAL